MEVLTWKIMEKNIHLYEGFDDESRSLEELHFFSFDDHQLFFMSRGTEESKSSRPLPQMSVMVQQVGLPPLALKIKKGTKTFFPMEKWTSFFLYQTWL